MNMSYSTWELDRLRRDIHTLALRHNPNIENAERKAYYPGKIVHLNDNNADNSWGNLAITCPCCEGLIMLSRYTPRDIWSLKARGLNYAEIGRILGLSRERVRQLCKRYEASSSQVDIEDAVNEAQKRERWLVKNGKLDRITDKRTWRKRLLAEAQKIGFIPKTKGGKP